MSEREFLFAFWIVFAALVSGPLIVLFTKFVRKPTRPGHVSSIKKPAVKSVQPASAQSPVSIERMVAQRMKYFAYDLASELAQIGQRDGFLAAGRSFDSSGKLIGNPLPPQGFNENWRNIRAIEIGHALNDRGGFDMMIEAHKLVQEEVGSQLARHLETCWGGIGDWRS